MNELLQTSIRYDLEPTTKFRRLISPTDLNIDELGQVKDLSEKINSLNKNIDFVEKSYGYTGESPLNDYPAPPNRATLAQHDQLSSQKYQSELDQFFAVVSSNLDTQAPEANQLIATDKQYQVSKNLSRHQPEKVRQDLGDIHYVNWLETSISAIELLGTNHPKSIDMVNIISQHLDVTEEFDALNPLKDRFDSISAIALLGLANTPNTMATVEASPGR